MNQDPVNSNTVNSSYDTLTEMPSFDEHMATMAQGESAPMLETDSESPSGPKPNGESPSRPKTNGERAQRVLELANLTELRKNEAVFDASLQGLTPDGAYKYLTTLNGLLRGVGGKDRGAREGVQVGEHMAPTRDVQDAILADTTNAIKSLKDNHYRAALAYYTVNNLHLFEDGNGRISRAVYEIFDNPHFDLSGDGFTHQTDSAYESGHHGKFEKAHGIRPAATAYDLARRALKINWAQDGQIDPRTIEMPSRLEIVFTTTPDVYLTDDAAANLTPEEKRAVNLAFHDGDVAFLSLCKKLHEKGTSGEVTDESIKTSPSGEKYMAIEVEREDLDTGEPNIAATHTFAGWTADDYRDFLTGFKAVQRDSQRTLNDIFLRPAEYQIRDDLTAADWLSNAN